MKRKSFHETKKKKLNHITIPLEFKQKFFFSIQSIYADICDMSYKNNKKKTWWRNHFSIKQLCEIFHVYFNSFLISNFIFITFGKYKVGQFYYNERVHFLYAFFLIETLTVLYFFNGFLCGTENFNLKGIKKQLLKGISWKTWFAVYRRLVCIFAIVGNTVIELVAILALESNWWQHHIMGSTFGTNHRSECYLFDLETVSK